MTRNPLEQYGIGSKKLSDPDEPGVVRAWKLDTGERPESPSQHVGMLDPVTVFSIDEPPRPSNGPIPRWLVKGLYGERS